MSIVQEGLSNKSNNAKKLQSLRESAGVSVASKSKLIAAAPQKDNGIGFSLPQDDDNKDLLLQPNRYQDVVKSNSRVDLNEMSLLQDKSLPPSQGGGPIAASVNSK